MEACFCFRFHDKTQGIFSKPTFSAFEILPSARNCSASFFQLKTSEFLPRYLTIMVPSLNKNAKGFFPPSNQQCLTRVAVAIGPPQAVAIQPRGPAVGTLGTASGQTYVITEETHPGLLLLRRSSSRLPPSS